MGMWCARVPVCPCETALVSIRHVNKFDTKIWLQVKDVSLMLHGLSTMHHLSKTITRRFGLTQAPIVLATCWRSWHQLYAFIF